MGDETKAVAEMNNKMISSKSLYVSLAQGRDGSRSQHESQTAVCNLESGVNDDELRSAFDLRKGKRKKSNDDERDPEDGTASRMRIYFHNPFVNDARTIDSSLEKGEQSGSILARQHNARSGERLSFSNERMQLVEGEVHLVKVGQAVLASLSDSVTSSVAETVSVVIDEQTQVECDIDVYENDSHDVTSELIDVPTSGSFMRNPAILITKEEEREEGESEEEEDDERSEHGVQYAPTAETPSCTMTQSPAAIPLPSDFMTAFRERFRASDCDDSRLFDALTRLELIAKDKRIDLLFRGRVSAMMVFLRIYMKFIEFT